MIHFKTFDDLTREVEQDDLGKWDRKVLAEAIELRYGKLRLSPHRGGTVSGLILSDRAIQNICELVGIPVDYFYRCPPPLQDVQFNFWLRECCRRDEAERKARLSSAPIQLLLRAKRDILRAVLAHDYPCFDHRDLLNFLKPKLRRRLAVSAYELEGDQLWITLVMPESARTVTKSHSYLLGCQLYNSEIAEAVITVRPVIVVESSETEIGCPTAPVELVHAAGAYDARHGFQTDVERAMETAFTTGRLYATTRWMRRGEHVSATGGGKVGEGVQTRTRRIRGMSSKSTLVDGTHRSTPFRRHLRMPYFYTSYRTHVI